MTGNLQARRRRRSRSLRLAVGVLVLSVCPLSGAEYKQLPPLEAKALAIAPQVQQSPELHLQVGPSLPSLRVSVTTDKAIYRDGEKVSITGRVVNIDGEPVRSLVDVRVAVKGKTDGKADLENPIYRNLLDVGMGEFVVDGYKVQMPAPDDTLHDNRVEFTVVARAEPIGGGVGDVAVASFSSEQLGWIRVGRILVPPAMFFLGLTIAALAFTMGQPSRRGVKWALIALYTASLLFLLSALAGPLLISFSPGTEALFRTTPVGIVKIVGATDGANQWVLNVGGVLDANGKIGGGFTVPLYILILSLIGAVISMFLKLPDFLKMYRSMSDDPTDAMKQASALGTEAFKYFTYIVTGPFLGMIVFSLASLVESTNVFVLSVVAFSVGFISDGIVETMVSFSEGLLDRAKRPKATGVAQASAPASSQEDGPQAPQ